MVVVVGVVGFVFVIGSRVTVVGTLLFVPGFIDVVAVTLVAVAVVAVVVDIIIATLVVAVIIVVDSTIWFLYTSGAYYYFAGCGICGGVAEVISSSS